MAVVTGIICQIMTGDVPRAGTDGNVCLGIGGREFHLDSGADDFERGSLRNYVLGRGPDYPDLPAYGVYVHNMDNNDPTRHFVIETQNLGRSPVYVRFEPENSGDNWNISSAGAFVFRNVSQFVVGYTPPVGFGDLWMGRGTGKVLYLTQEWPGVEPMIRHLAKKEPALLQQFKPRRRSKGRKRSSYRGD
jgi:hypothetical protein